MSEVKTNKLTGTSTAGSILVTGEGNSTTTNLQQGLAKHWANFNGTSTPAIRDSFNASSITDVGTGLYHLLYSNNMGNTNNAPIGVSNNYATSDNFGGSADTALGTTASSLTLGIATTGYSFATYDGGYLDAILNQAAVFGDLA
jgi:hypothetical protein